MQPLSVREIMPGGVEFCSVEDKSQWIIFPHFFHCLTSPRMVLKSSLFTEDTVPRSNNYFDLVAARLMKPSSHWFSFLSCVTLLVPHTYSLDSLIIQWSSGFWGTRLTQLTKKRLIYLTSLQLRTLAHQKTPLSEWSEKRYMLHRKRTQSHNI